MKTLKQFVETLDRPAHSRISHDSGEGEIHRFAVNGIKYTLDFMYSDGGYELEYGWDMYDADGRPNGSYDPKAKQPHPIRVLSTVIDIVRKKLDDEPYRSIHFYADKKLIGVYDAIAAKFAKDSKYKVDTQISGSGKNYVIRNMDKRR